MTKRSEVYKAIDTERDYQDQRWNENTTTSNGYHEVGAWLTFLRTYIREAEEIISRNGDPEATDQSMHTIRKIAAMCVCCMEQHGAPHRISKANASQE